MVDHQHWQLDGNAPELFQRYLVPEVISPQRGPYLHTLLALPRPTARASQGPQLRAFRAWVGRRPWTA